MPARKQRPVSKPGRWRKRSAETQPPRDSDYLLDAVTENWPHILTMYRYVEEKKPIVLCDLQEGRIYAYPYEEFKQELSERSQLSLEEQYAAAVREGKMVVFARDNEARRLVSFALDIE